MGLITDRKSLCDAIIKNHLKGKFKLPQGNIIDEYFDMYPILLSWDGCQAVSYLFGDLIGDNKLDSIGCIELCPVPLLSSLADIIGFPDRSFIVRKRRKGYGANRLIEGNFRSGDKVLLIEDVISTGESIKKTANIIEDLGGTVEMILAIVNRDEGCKETLKGYDVRQIFYAKEFE